MLDFQAYDDERLRAAINLQDAYSAWLDAKRTRHAHHGRMAWKRVSGRNYLYKLFGKAGNGRSLGPESEETHTIHDRFQQAKQQAKSQLADRSPVLETAARVYRTLPLPLIKSSAAAILQEADVRGILGREVIVVGTTALAAYQLEAAARFVGAPESTADFDLAWMAEMTPDEAVLWPALKAVDSSYTVNTERPYQARNSKANDVELLAGPAHIDTLKREPFSPINLPEHDWLLNGNFVNQVVCGLDGRPARIITPDPRWFALQKAWLSLQGKRNPLKRPKDACQAAIVWSAVAERMPQFPTDSGFVSTLPQELQDAKQRVIDQG